MIWLWTMYELGNDKGVSPPNPQNQIIEAEVDPGLIFFHPSSFPSFALPPLFPFPVLFLHMRCLWRLSALSVPTHASESQTAQIVSLCAMLPVEAQM